MGCDNTAYLLFRFMADQGLYDGACRRIETVRCRRCFRWKSIGAPVLQSITLIDKVPRNISAVQTDKQYWSRPVDLSGRGSDGYTWREKCT